MPAAWARMIYVCGFLQDKGVLYRIRHRNLRGFLASLLRARKFMHFARACRAYAHPLFCKDDNPCVHYVCIFYFKEPPFILACDFS